MNRNNKISIVGYSISLVVFLIAMICSFIEAINYVYPLLFIGGVLLVLTSLYKIFFNSMRNKN